MRKHDHNGDQRLQPSEWAQMGGDPRLADLDGDGLITQDEMIQRAAEYGRDRRIRPQRPLLGGGGEFLPLLRPATEPRSSDAPTVGTPPEDRNASPLAEGVPDAGTDRPRDPRRDRKFAARYRGMPEWFIDRDANGDGQLTMAEFAPKATRSELDRFTRYDADRNGVITAAEYRRIAKPSAGATSP